jgi:hypothetical protein
LLLGALRVPDVTHGLFVRPALLSRLAQAARGRFARLDSPLREIRFLGLRAMIHAIAGSNAASGVALKPVRGFRWNGDRRDALSYAICG